MKVNSTHTVTNSIHVSTDATPGYTHAEGLTAESASRVSELLTINHGLYHTRFNGGLHNHIAHHLLGLWALGATPDEMQYMWNFNVPYQSPLEQRHNAAVSKDVDLKDPELFDECLGKDEKYADFLRFFEDEVAENGVQHVIREYVLKGDNRANDIFCRMYTDLVHPMIHLGYALEFNSPSLVAEALAAACVHDNWPKDFLLPTETYVQSNADVPSKPLLQIFDSLRNDPHIFSAVEDTDPFNKIRDGLLKRVTGAQLVPHLSQFQVRPTPEDLQRKLNEMMHTNAYMVGAAQRPGKRERIDFVLLHSITLAVFYPAILSLDWLTDMEKARLLEAKTRVDAVMYAACKCPVLYPERVLDYVPRSPKDGWEELFHRANVYQEEGHIVKLIRGLYCLEQLGETEEGFPVKRRDFVKIAHMSLDSVEEAMKSGGCKMSKEIFDRVAKRVGQGGEMVAENMMRWVFYGGLPLAWQNVPELETAVDGWNGANRS